MGKKDDTDIEGLLRRDPTRWMTSGEIGEALPHIKKTLLYLSVSNMTLKDKTLVRRNRPGGGNEYQLAENVVTQQKSPPSITSQEETTTTPRKTWVQPPTTTMRDTIRDALSKEYEKLDWTDDEKLRVAAQYMQIKKVRSWLSPNEALREAQKILPVSRQYKVTLDRSTLPWFDEFIQKATFNANKPAQINVSVAEQRDNEMRSRMAANAVVTHKVAKKIENPHSPSKPVVITPPVPPSPPQQEKSDGDYGEPDKVEETPLINDRLPQEPEPRVVEIPLDVASVATDALVGEIMNRATKALKKIVIDVFSSPEVRKALTLNVNVQLNTVQKPSLDPQPPAVTTENEERRAEERRAEERRAEERREEPSKPKLKKVLIAGLLNAQQREIENEFGDVLDVRFWKTDESINTLKSRAGYSDYTILVRDFLRHDHVHQVEKAGVRMYKHHGGMTKLKDVLTGVYVGDENIIRSFR